MKYELLHSSLGLVGIAVINGQVVKVIIDTNQNDFTNSLKLDFGEKHPSKGGLDAFLLSWLYSYLDGFGLDISKLKLNPQGTPFQRSVWQEIQDIPFGEVIAYGDLAKDIGCKSAQAIGQALGANPIPIIIPCHRVIASDFKLGGFSGGVEKKIMLLQHEGWTIENGRLKKIKE